MTENDGETPVLRWPSLRQPLDVLFLFCCVLLTADVLVPEIFGNGKTKDYALWFWAGRQVLTGGDLYKSITNGALDFIYPPPPAVMLAIPAWFGKIPLYLGLSILNSAAWAITSQLSNAMTGSKKIPAPWLAALPGFATVTFVFDQYDLGQPNLVLLAMMLLGFWWMQKGRPWLGGSMFALATAIKMFPVAVLPYLLWRRRWAASASMVVATLALLYVMPAPVRGFERNAAELKTWFSAMVGSSSEKGFGQRDEQNWSWVNQSLIAVTHRLVRPINYYMDDPRHAPEYMNVLDVSYKTANWIVLAVIGLIGLGFICVIPAYRKMTERSTAEELGILFCLMTVASPLARQYYFMWLFMPLTVLMHRAAFDARPKVRTGTWTLLGIVGVLMVLSLPVFPAMLQAWGNNLLATALLVGGLIWHMHHAPPLLDSSEVPERVA
ncbi:glycosyltransferase family 87 protein [Tardiphaga sp.]|uniref:glycosyltransferase family 87 protein n=1 Tax=Tardiphaga sp. TaxID=1926292 RepID=UPI00260B5934|nr:glycosyltransferase family 87 protein [Tardiphaga sp.]